jgi:hypothetical protein
VQARDRVGVVDEASIGPGVLQECAAQLAGGKIEIVHVRNHNVHAECSAARLRDRDRLGMDVMGHEETVAFPFPAARQTEAHHHRLGRRRGLVEERRVGHRQSGEVGDHRLKDEQRLEPTLRDLRLVRCVLRVPAGVLEDVAQDDGWCLRPGVAHTDAGGEDLVAIGQLPQLPQQLRLRACRAHGERPARADRFRDRLADQGLERVATEKLQHGGHVGVARADVTILEAIGSIENALAALRIVRVGGWIEAGSRFLVHCCGTSFSQWMRMYGRETRSSAGDHGLDRTAR